MSTKSICARAAVLRVALVSFLSFTAVCPAQGLIRTFAGADWSFPVDGRSSMDAPIGSVSGMVVDSAGALIVADPASNVIFKISTDGSISLVAGNGLRGFSGDGGPATRASLFSPYGLALEASGALYVSTAGDHRIRRVSSTGTITTVAGSGTAGFSGDGGPAIAAKLNKPTGLAVDNRGSIFFSDSNNNRIRRIDSAGLIATVAGDGRSTFAGDGGPAVSAGLQLPQSLAYDATEDRLLVADTGNNRIRTIALVPRSINSIAGGGSGFSGDGGPAASATMRAPQGVFLSSGTIYISDTG